jgi:hypothetical protein
MFNADGYLQAGFHSMTAPQIEAAFVKAFPHSTTRCSVFAGYEKHSTDLQAIVAMYGQFINGSFVTNKNDPSDVDTVVFIDADTVDALPADDQAKLFALLSGPATKATHMCDAYFCPIYPMGHAGYESFRANRKYWMGEFGFDRTDKPKGIVTVTVMPPPSSATAGPSP